MKCITVKQPWATLLAGGATRYLVRGWRTFHRGPLVIAASRRFPRPRVELCCDPDMRAILRCYGYDYAMELPTGMAIGMVNLADCLLVTRDTLSLLDPNDPAVGFGWVQIGCWAWLCTEPRTFVPPVPLSGRPGVYSIPTTLIPVR